MMLQLHLRSSYMLAGGLALLGTCHFPILLGPEGVLVRRAGRPRCCGEDVFEHRISESGDCEGY
jgi:hypothetical protein